MPVFKHCLVGVTLLFGFLVGLPLRAQPAATGVFGQPDYLSTAAPLNDFVPSGVAVDPVTGKLFVSDTYRHRVLRFSSVAAHSDGLPAEAVLGQSNFRERQPGQSARQFNEPVALAIDNAGHLYVSDYVNRRVLRFDDASSKPSGAPADGILGQPDFATAIGTTSRSGLLYPRGLAVDQQGTLFVCDSDANRILRFDDAAQKPNGAPADGVLGQPDFTSSQSSVSQTGFNHPQSLTVDAEGRLYVADWLNNRVLRFDEARRKPNGGLADGVLGQSSFTSNSFALEQGAAYITSPVAVAADAAGHLFVSNEQRILRFDEAAGKPNGAAANGVLIQPDFTSLVSNPLIRGAYALALASEDRLFAADSPSRKVFRFDNASKLPNGAPPAATFQQAGPVGSSEVQSPYDVVLDGTTGKVFVSDLGNNRILRFASPQALAQGQPAESVLGQPDFIRAVPALSREGLNRPSGLGLDPNGRLYVADLGNNRVVWFDRAATKSIGAPADGVLGQPDFTTSRGLPSNVADRISFHLPQDVAADATGHLFIADTGNNRVLRFDGMATKPNGAPADGVLGQPDYSFDYPTTSATRMRSPSGLALDEQGRLFVADYYSNRVLRFDEAATKPNGAPADGVLGQATFNEAQYATTRSGMTLPLGLALDPRGRLFVAEPFNNRVLRFDDAATLPNGASAALVFGQPDFTSHDPSTTQATFYNPAGVGVAPQEGLLFVADTGNNRVLAFRTPAVAAEPVEGALEALRLTLRGGRVEVRVAEAQRIRVEAFSVLGQRVATLFVGEATPGQLLTLDLPPNLAAGVYVVQATGAQASVSRPVILR